MTRRMGQRTRRVNRRLLIHNASLITLSGSNRYDRYRRTRRQCSSTTKPANRQLRLTQPARRTAHNRRRTRCHTGRTRRNGQARRRNRISTKRVAFTGHTFRRYQTVVARCLRRSLTPAWALAPALQRNGQLLIMRGHDATVTSTITVRGQVRDRFGVFDRRVRLPSLIPLRRLTKRRGSHATRITEKTRGRAQIERRSQFASRPRHEAEERPIVHRVRQVAMTNRGLRSKTRHLIRFLRMILIRLIVNVRRRMNLVIINRTNIRRISRRVNRHVPFTSRFRVITFRRVTTREPRRINNIINTIINCRPSISRIKQMNLVTGQPGGITSRFFFITHKSRRNVPINRQNIKRTRKLNRRKRRSARSLVCRTNAASSCRGGVRC